MNTKFWRLLFNPILWLVLIALFLYFVLLLSLNTTWYVLPYNLGNLLLALALLIVGLMLTISPRFAIYWFLEMLPIEFKDEYVMKDENAVAEWLILRAMGLISVAISLVVIYTSAARLIQFLFE